MTLQVPRRVKEALFSVDADGELIFAYQCSLEARVIVYAENPTGADNPGNQTLTIQVLFSMDNVKFVDAGEQRLIDIPAGERRLVAVDVEVANYYEVIGVSSGAGITNVPIRIDHQK